MKWFYDLKTAYKLALAFGICLLLSCIVGITAISRMAQMNQSAKMLNEDTIAGLKYISSVINDCKQFRLFQLRRLLVTNQNDMDKLESQMNTMASKIDDDFKKYEDSSFNPEDKANLQELRKRWTAYLAFKDQITELEKNGHKDEAAKMMNGETLTTFNSAIDQVELIVDWNIKHGDKLYGDAQSAYDSAKSVLIILVTLAVVIGIFMATVVTKIVTNNLNQVRDRLESLAGLCLTNLGKAIDALAHGDLTAKIQTGTKALEIDSKDEFGILATAVNTMIKRTQGSVASFEEAQKSLSELIAQAKLSSDNIARGSQDVATGNEDLSQRTTEQAASLEETASSMEEMTATVKQNAESSRQANQLAVQARTVANDGGVVVGKAVTSMEEINSASKRIADIISVIDEIAFQTNLLALNAAVEAARVGEQGRGFAVVAAEVRNLAGRSSTAAKEIKSLVQDTVHKVQEGSELVNQSGQTLGEIVSSVKKVADIIEEISAASQEQSAGIEQVNKAIMQMDQITQQNAALVEEATAAAQSMSQQAFGLKDVVSKFKLDDNYMYNLQQQAAFKATQQTMTVDAKATGTYGKQTGGIKSSKKNNLKLSISHNDKDEFEEF